MKHFLPIFAFSLFTTAGFSQVSFTEKPFEQAVAQAKSENKLVMVDSYTDWCGWCKVMDRETFSDSLVGDFVNPRFLSTKINMEEGFGIDLAMKYRVSFYPQYLFFDGDGHLIGRLGGYMEAHEFMESLTEIAKPENYLPPLEKSMDFMMDYPDFYRETFKKRNERKASSAEEIEAFLNTRDDVSDEVTWAVVSRFITTGPFAEKAVRQKNELIKKYGKDEVIEKLSSFVFADVKTAIKNNSENELNAALTKADNILGDDAATYKLRYRMYFYQMTADWDAYAAIGENMAGDTSLRVLSTLNQMGWTIYENGGEPATQKALAWMKSVVSEKASYAFLNTYAALLYKANQKDEAMIFAQAAIDAAAQEGVDANGTVALMEKIKRM